MIGLRPADVQVPKHCDAMTSAEAERRFRAAPLAAAWIKDHHVDDDGADYFGWEVCGHRAPVDVLAQAFTRDELIRIWHDSTLASKLDDHLRDHDLTWKVSNSLWRYGCEKSYERVLAFLAGLSRIDAGVPGFEARVTHTRAFNTAAWSAHVDSCDPRVGIYLDASFGVLLHYKGKHVMTIGFAPSRHGILLAQVQLREKHGNRFLYKLPMPHLDFALDLLRRAFPDEPIWIVTGKSTTEAIRRAYHKDDRDKFKPETAVRIERFYDQPLRGYARTDETVRCGSDDGREWVRLSPVSVSEALQAA